MAVTADGGFSISWSTARSAHAGTSQPARPKTWIGRPRAAVKTNREEDEKKKEGDDEGDDDVKGLRKRNDGRRRSPATSTQLRISRPRRQRRPFDLVPSPGGVGGCPP
eukprot:8176383-Pyramimonas_sp.AAC.1